MAIIEGVGDFIPGMLSFGVSLNHVSIFDKTTKKTVFDDKWQNLQKEDGSTFNDETLLIEYLETIFEDVILLEVDTNEIQYITRNEAQTDFINS